ncbi:hypothetical protein [Streptomyces sp. NPDC001480]|uniref:hypothetical protein n=1 Tax=Streptomyces sp. NPDC001480 TaxID=3364577 RepID=UPI003688343E
MTAFSGKDTRLKVRALHDRGFPREVIDVFSARELYTLGKLERLGAQHDEEFDLEELHGRSSTTTPLPL